MTTRALLDHLTRAYGARHARLTLLHSANDKGIYRVDRDDGPSWVLRQFPAARPFERVEGDAAILRHVRHLPVEQVVEDVDGGGATQVDGRGVIVTRFIEGKSASPTPDLLRAVGAIVGSIHVTQYVPGDDAHLRRRAGALPKEDLGLAHVARRCARPRARHAARRVRTALRRRRCDRRLRGPSAMPRPQ
ncbi:MAG: phosphotransferase [Candidatus Limnocylindria bacterium]